MTMTYSGAIKSAVYGFYLRFTGASFTVESWRLLGIAIVAVALPLFSILARRRLTVAALLTFFALLLTDATVVLETRHDWGPVALALALRLCFLGLWLHGQGGREIRPRNSLLLGAVVGFSIYEKLSSIVLLPVLVILLCCPGSTDHPPLRLLDRRPAWRPALTDRKRHTPRRDRAPPVYLSSGHAGRQDPGGDGLSRERVSHARGRGDSPAMHPRRRPSLCRTGSDPPHRRAVGRPGTPVDRGRTSDPPSSPRVISRSASAFSPSRIGPALTTG